MPYLVAVLQLNILLHYYFGEAFDRAIHTANEHIPRSSEIHRDFPSPELFSIAPVVSTT